MPSDAELGPLVHTVIRPQPLLDAATREGFAPGTHGSPKRFAFWGDSHVAAGPFAPTLIQVLRDRGLSVETRFMPPTMGRANVRLPGLRAYCIGPDWTTELAYRSSDTVDIGPALADRIVDGGDGSYLWLDVRNDARQSDVQRMQLVYRTPIGAFIDYAIDDQAPHRVYLPPTTVSRVVDLGAGTPISTLKMSVAHGRLVLQGFIQDRTPTPAVTFDFFGIPSSTAKGWANVDPKALARALHGVDYDAVILEYGTNAGVDPDHFDGDDYAGMLNRALGNLRQVFPDATCLLVGPPDRGVLEGRRGRHDPLFYSRVHQRIEQIQRQVGSQYGCAVWSWQDLMGGPGGSYGWALADPSLMGRDLTHFTSTGYRLVARSLAQSLGWLPEGSAIAGDRDGR